MRAFLPRRSVVAGLSVIAVAAAPVAVGPSASAATLTPTTIRMNAALGLKISYANRQITLGGTLETGPSAASPYQGIGGEPVDLTLIGPDGATVVADLGTVTTAADGTFSLTATLPNPGRVNARFAGDATYAAGAGRVGVVPSAFLPTRVQLDPLPATVDPNTDFKLSGQVQEQAPDGSWVPADQAGVRVSEGLGNFATVYVGQDGRFSFTAREPYPVTWQVQVQQTIASFASSATSAPVLVNVPPEQTRITSFTVQSAGTAQNGLTFTVHADFLANGQWKPYYGSLDLYFQPKGSSSWQTWSTAVQFGGRTVNGNGDQILAGFIGPYVRIPGAHPHDFDSLVSQDGSWKAQVEPVTASPGVIGVLPSTSSVIPTVLPKYGTAFVNETVVAKGRSRYLHASLWEPCWAIPGSSPGYCGMVPNQTVKLYVRYSGKKSWHYAGTTTVNGDGDLSIKLPGTRRWYRLVYSGSSQYAGTTSDPIYSSS